MPPSQGGDSFQPSTRRHALTLSFIEMELDMTSKPTVLRRRRSSRGEERIYWPQPALDHLLIAALYQTDPGTLSHAARHLSLIAAGGIRHFSAVRRAVPLQQAKAEEVHLKRIEKEERREL
jgi:hypothetical protein